MVSILRLIFISSFYRTLTSFFLVEDFFVVVSLSHKILLKIFTVKYKLI